MTIYAAYNVTTEIVEGFYDTENYVGTVPTPNITITAGELTTALALQDTGAILKRSGASIIDGTPVADLATYKTEQIRETDIVAALKVRALMDYPAEQALIQMEKVREADFAEHSADAAMTQANYPLLAAEVTSDGDTMNHTNLSAKGDAIQAAWKTTMTSIETIEVARLDGIDAINAAGTVGAVDSAVAAIAWPA